MTQPSQQPWARVDQPTPLPQQPTAPDLLAMPDDDFAVLLRDHLLPRGEPRSPERNAWEQLWAALKSRDDVRDRAYALLERYIHYTQEQLQEDAVPESAVKRARKFLVNLDMAWDRLDRRDLSTDGRRRLSQYDISARRTVLRLVWAIADHREAIRAGQARARPADHELWEIIKELGLEPVVERA